MFLIFFISTSLFSIINANQIIDFKTSRIVHDTSLIDYWTSERMINAQSKSILSNNASTFLQFYHSKVFHTRLNNLSQSIPPTLPIRNISQRSSILYDTSKMPRVIGKLFFTINGGLSFCSAGVVSATNQDSVVTAAHCLYDSSSRTLASNLVFVPQYNNRQRPFGTWTVRSFYIHSSWITRQDWNSDIAMVLLNTNNFGQHIQGITGSLGIIWNGDKKSFVNLFGYPLNKGNGELINTCAEQTSATFDIPTFNGLHVPCDLTYGISGGPWIEQYDTTTKNGYIKSISSFMNPYRPEYLYGPYFDNNIYNLYKNCERL